MAQMIIQVGRSSKFDLVFEIDSHPIAELWTQKMHLRHSWPMDNPDRFYGFNDIEAEKKRAINQINANIRTINQYQQLIQRTLTDVTDQDTLNYLHNIFEIYHRQLDQQTHDFWMSAPETVRQALSDLNINVHRCESLRTGTVLPRFVCTWFGMPKIDTLSNDLKQQYGTEYTEFGGVYLNYVEIGKTALEMANDNDQYMAKEMFQPFNHYSADFRVDFYDDTLERVQERRDTTFDYFRSNLGFFSQFGIDSPEDVRIRPIKFKVAQLLYESQDKEYIISQIQKDQYVSSVILQ